MERVVAKYDLDLGGAHHLLNLPAPGGPAEPARLQDLALTLGTGGTQLALGGVTAGQTLVLSGSTLVGAPLRITVDAINTGSGTKLSTFDATGLTDGTAAWTTSVRQAWDLVTTAAAVDHITVEAALNNPTRRWIRRKRVEPTWALEANFWVDPSNVSGVASDENVGTSSGTPLLTYRELGRRLYELTITQTTVTINAMSDVLSTSDVLFLEGLKCANSTGFVFVNVVGQTTTIASGLTVSAAHNMATLADHDHYEITIPGAVYTPWIQRYLLHRTNGTQGWAWAYKDLGSSNLHTSLPTTTAGTSLTTWAVGDSVDVLKLPRFSQITFVGCDPLVFGKVSTCQVIGGPIGNQHVDVQTFDRCLFNADVSSFVGFASENSDRLQLFNTCITGCAVSIAGQVTFWSVLIVGDGGQVGSGKAVQCISSDSLGGNTANTIMLGNCLFSVSHEAIYEKLQVLIYDWTNTITGASVSFDHLARGTISTIGGERNTAALLSVDTGSTVVNYGFDWSLWNSAITTYPTPYFVAGAVFTQADLGIGTNMLATHGCGIIWEIGQWSNDLSGTGINPSVVAIHESGGGRLPIGSIPVATPNQYLQWNGTAIVGVTGISPGGSAGGDLAGTYPNPTIAANAVTNAKFRQSAALSVVGNATNATANVADISTSSGSGAVLHESGGALVWGAIPETAVTNLVTDLAAKAVVTSSAPLDVGTSAVVGTATDAARSDHVHRLPFATLLSVLGAASSSIAFNTQRLTNLADPVASSDAATKAYVDAAVSGLTVKPSVLALSTSNIASLSGLATTVDGIALNTDGQRVLLTAQTTASQNGIWVVHSGAWTRPSDFATGSHAAGDFTFVEEGTVNGDNGWVCTSDPGSDVVDTNSLTWTQFSGAGQIIAGTGLSKSGNTLSLSNVGPGAGTIGSAGIASITLNAQGQVTAATTATYALQSIALTGSGAIKIAGDNLAHDLSANRTISLADFVASGASHAAGGVPDPGSTAGTHKMLREDATWAIPDALHETSGPTDLVLGAWADGQVLARSGSTAVGADPSYVWTLSYFADANHAYGSGDWFTTNSPNTTTINAEYPVFGVSTATPAIQTTKAFIAWNLIVNGLSGSQTFTVSLMKNNVATGVQAVFSTSTSVSSRSAVFSVTAADGDVFGLQVTSSNLGGTAVSMVIAMTAFFYR
jgi:hypothetical protein